MKKIVVVPLVLFLLFTLFLVWMNVTPGEFDYDDGGEDEACSCTVIYSKNHRQKAFCNKSREIHCDMIIPSILISFSRLDFKK